MSIRSRSSIFSWVRSKNESTGEHIQMEKKNNYHASESISVVDIGALPSSAPNSGNSSISETKPLVSAQDDDLKKSDEMIKKNESTATSSNTLSKMGLSVLLLLAVQNTSKNLLLRAVMKEHPKFLTSAAILGVETVKLTMSLLYIVCVQRRPAFSAVTFMKQDKRNTILMAIPATLYSIQMTLEYVALGNIDASVFSVLVQMKVSFYPYDQVQ